MAVEDFGDTVHGGEEHNVSLANHRTDHVRFFIVKLHIHDGIERKFNFIREMPGAVHPHHRNTFRQQRKIDAARRGAGGGQQHLALSAILQFAEIDQRNRFPFVFQGADFAARRARDMGKRPEIFVMAKGASMRVAIDLLK